MQLKKQSVRNALAAGAAAMMGATNSASALPAWDVETGVASYVEMGGRITVVELTGVAKTHISDDKTLKLKVSLDTVTGASPNGATATSQPQTFTSPSGNTPYEAKPGDIPLDPTFRDTRVGGSATWEQDISTMVKGNVGINAGSETDHLSIGVNGGLSLDMNNRNTTLFAGVSAEWDQVAPVGGVPHRMVTTGPGVVKTVDTQNDSFTVADALVGLTQTISRRMLTQINYSHSLSNGYLSNPYKVLSAVNGATGETIDYVFENRPADRTKQSVFWRIKYSFDQDVLDLSYRYMWDSWTITSHTAELKYYWILSSGGRLEPFVRYYTQTAADFYTPSLVYADTLPQYASADARLAKFDATTVGILYSMKMDRKSEMGIRLEYYAQKGTDHPAEAIGIQKGYDLYPETSAFVAQLLWSF